MHTCVFCYLSRCVSLCPPSHPTHTRAAPSVDIYECCAFMVYVSCVPVRYICSFKAYISCSRHEQRTRPHDADTATSSKFSQFHTRTPLIDEFIKTGRYKGMDGIKPHSLSYETCSRVPLVAKTGELTLELDAHNTTPCTTAVKHEACL